MSQLTPPTVVAICSLLLSALLCDAFTPQTHHSSSKHSSIHHSSTTTSLQRPPPLSYSNGESSSSEVTRAPPLLRPSWIPMELVELAAEDLKMTSEEFVSTFADVEAYTSCDDEGDDLHECDFFGQYLGPTKWLHLVPAAHQSVDQIHFAIWKDVWSHPHSMVDVADKVSKETLRYYKEFMLEPRTSSDNEINPCVRVKVVPASFGVEGFEEAVWEATEHLLERSGAFSSGKPEGPQRKAITFVVAAPDLADPILMEGRRASPQAEFDADSFRAFAASLKEKLYLFSQLEGIPVDDAIQLTPFHPMWKADFAAVELEGRLACASFPYPCVALSTDVAV